MKYIVEMRNGDWLRIEATGRIGGTDDPATASTFETIRLLRDVMKHQGIAAYDVWTEDGKTWCGDQVDTLAEELRRPGREVPPRSAGQQA
jgi:hypothetical protein